MKRIFALCAAVLMIFSVVSCTQKEVTLVVLEDKLAPEEYGIGFRKEDTNLAAAVGNVLADMKEDGTLAKISETWFGKDVTTISGKR